MTTNSDPVNSSDEAVEAAVRAILAMPGTLFKDDCHADHIQSAGCPADMTDIAATDEVQFSRQYTEGPETDDWPPPDEVIEHRATGELADRIRARLGVSDQSAEVLLIHTTVTGGSSEFTEEIDYFFEVKCGDKGKDFTMGYDDSTAENGLVKLLGWLDEGPTAGDNA